MTIEEYAKSNYRFLNRYQAMLFISNGAKLEGCYVSYDKNKDEHNMIYVFEKNKENEELLIRFRNYDLKWGDNIIEFTSSNPGVVIR